jgi:hypothetical protein
MDTSCRAAVVRRVDLGTLSKTARLEGPVAFFPFLGTCLDACP